MFQMFQEFILNRNISFFFRSSFLSFFYKVSIKGKFLEHLEQIFKIEIYTFFLIFSKQKCATNATKILSLIETFIFLEKTPHFCKK